MPQSEFIAFGSYNHLTRLYDRENNLLTLKETIIAYMKRGHSIYLSDFGGDSERLIRKTISKQRKVGPIYLPDGQGDHRYVRIDHLDQEIIEAYNRTQVKSARSHYFDTIRPVLAYSKDAKLIALMGTLDLAYGPEEQDAKDKL